MTEINRRPIFDAVRMLRDGRGFTLDEVHLLDAGIDAAFGSVAPVAAVLPLEPPKPAGLGKPSAFFDHLRGSRMLGPTLSEEEVKGCTAILTACGEAHWPISWTAYALATAYHETAGTMQPIREYGRGRGRRYGVAGKHGQVAYGRGYVQLTWDYNYEKADAKLGLKGRLTRDYELALDPTIAGQIMVRGLAEGWFTGKKLSDTLPAGGPASTAQFIASRPIINGRDKDKLIAGYAIDFQKALAAGVWR